MRILSISFLVLLFGSSCVSTKVHGLKTESPGSKIGYFKTVKSCQPVLKWQKSEDPATTYDVAVYKSLGDPDRDGVPPERGDQVFYQEAITEPQVTITPVLAPKTKYLWSVRTRRSTEEVSEWSTYDKNVNLGYYFSEAKGFWFGIKTPDCQESISSLQKVETSQDTRLPYKFRGKSDFKENEMIEHFKNGEGGFILGNFNYGVKERKADLRKYQSLEDVISHETEPLSPKRIPIFLYFVPPNGQEEKKIQPNNENLFILIGPPGQYTLTRLVYNWGDTFIYSHRLSLSVVVDSGQLKYGGDIISLAYKNMLHIYAGADPYFRFRPEQFRQQIRLHFPSIGSYLTDSQIDFKPPLDAHPPHPLVELSHEIKN